MVAPINIVMPVRPVAKARARLTFVNGHSQSYTPDATAQSETEIQLEVREYLRHTLNRTWSDPPYFPAKMPLRVEVLFVVPLPAKMPKGRRMPVTRPDIDNYFKLIMDALNKYLYPDDSQVTTALIQKRYGLVPSIYLCVQEDKEVDSPISHERPKNTPERAPSPAEGHPGGSGGGICRTRGNNRGGMGGVEGARMPGLP